MDKTPAKGPRGGKRIGAGRPKQRPTSSAVATRVLAVVKVEQLWVRIITHELAKLDADPGKAFTGALRETLKYLENRSLGNCVDTVNHLHDKPLELNVTVSLAEAVQRARKRAGLVNYPSAERDTVTGDLGQFTHDPLTRIERLEVACSTPKEAS
jgi:hypothetical protein